MLLYNLQAIFKARQIEKPYSYMVKAGISPNTATRILNNNTKSVLLEHIEKICEILYCEPNDLFIYKPNPNNKLQDKHPLYNLSGKSDELLWLEKLKTIPLSQLKQMSKTIEEAK
jgi:DNA-binding Xre family transcriptional regulator